MGEVLAWTNAKLETKHLVTLIVISQIDVMC